MKNNLRRVVLALWLSMPALMHAQNPFIREQYAADPTARVFGNKVYVYPSHDIIPPQGQRTDWFCMADYHVFSSENLTQWTDHGVILSQQDVPWGNPEGYSMWAPDCVEKDGRYYFYYPNATRQGRGFAIGVATATSPTGPFTPEAKPIEGVTGIDPCVLIDDDGQAYIYWSGMGIRGARLRADMKSLDGELHEVELPRRDSVAAPARVRVGGEEMRGLPEGFKEGPFAFKRDGRYYLTFPWVRGQKGADGNNPTETLAYAMADTPLGPWTFKGIIMAEHDNGCWTNHHSLLHYKGEWYLFYHRNWLSPNDDKRRSPCIERVAFNADGTIQEVKQTLRGVGINQATEKIHIDRYTSASDDVTTQLIDTVAPLRGYGATLQGHGSWLRYDGVDFSCLTDAYLAVCAKAADNTELCIRAQSPHGRVIARVTMTVKSEMRFPGMTAPRVRDQSNQWLTLATAVEYVPKGVTDLFVTCNGAPVSIDWVQFKNRPAYFTPAATATAHPDAQGYIRRWMLLEPIRQDIRSNTIFTNSWLNEVFHKTWFKGQMTAIPHDGQQVKAAGQTLKWHALDSEHYNMRLFRFAEKYGSQTYGSLFWGVTVIDCPEELKDVRLAAGSNGASIWWLNGEEVLMLEGDRRMVEDDGMSARLTLRKGRNVLRCAVINGPGLSDFCVRFLGEGNTPVTNYELPSR